MGVEYEQNTGYMLILYTHVKRGVGFMGQLDGRDRWNRKSRRTHGSTEAGVAHSYCIGKSL